MNKNIGILGGGNIGTALSVELTHKGFDVFLYTSKPDRFYNPLSLIDYDLDVTITEYITSITGDLQKIFDNCSVIIITMPSNTFMSLNNKIQAYVRKGTKIIVLPGTGGSEYVFKNLIHKGICLIGLQRVPAVYRLKEYGKTATISGRRKKGLHVSSIPVIGKDELTKLIEELFGLEVHILKNYLNVTLTPSNPILHTSRLYTLFSNSDTMNSLYSTNPFFYGEWDIESSKNLIACDNELQEIKKALLPLDLEEVQSLLVHYDSHDDISLTKKISSIPSLSTLKSPMTETNKGYKVDYSSRYFTADFPDGIVIIKSIALLCDVHTPMMDKIIFWYQKMTNKVYFKDSKTFGKDIVECNCPQNYGISNLMDFINYYV